MTLPNYLVIGAQKSATSSVCDLLAAHPEAFMTDPKEPYFFSHDEVWSKGLAWYESLFAGAEGCKAIGEGSTTYTQPSLYPHAAERIASTLPDARLIYIVRHPLERIRSHWMHLRTKGNRERTPFNAAVRSGLHGYLDNTLYSRQIDIYRARYPDERILALFFEDFRRDPDALMRRVFEFLGIDPDFRLSDAGKPRHVSAQGRIDTPVLTPLRRIPGFGALRDALPAGLRERVRGVLKKPVGERPEYDDETRRWVIAQLAQDNREFLRRYGKPDDYWGIDWDS
ncbi:MAG: sulfotransferase [Phycisphaeraceae bacterium]|nr:sulfotransferase [Phycisphaeraceae bacterium]